MGGLEEPGALPLLDVGSVEAGLARNDGFHERMITRSGAFIHTHPLHSNSSNRDLFARSVVELCRRSRPTAVSLQPALTCTHIIAEHLSLYLCHSVTHESHEYPCRTEKPSS